jgi:hypothetical protein
MKQVDIKAYYTYIELEGRGCLKGRGHYGVHVRIV